jgi:succinate dehydrogenase/fumarate reductase flavoprotein subunit
MVRQGQLRLGALTVPVYSLNTLVVGSGAAGLNCAEHLVRYMEQVGLSDATDRVAVVTEALGAGTSHNSGSDKQTYYRLGVCGNTADTPLELAQTLAAGGSMHGDIALCEAENSAREFYHLVENGVPFPHDDRGMFVGYKTDHDPRQRATSAGPRTSRFMVQRALQQLRRYPVAIFEHQELIGILTVPVEGAELAGHDLVQRRCVGAVTIDKTACDQPHFGLTLWNCQNVVVATGGPGAMYKVSVYPPGQMGSHGVLFEAGCVAHNLTESQFGLASIAPRWNVSGTYQQVIPNYFSTDANGGDRRHFLNRYFAGQFRSPQEAMRQLASSLFLKGYQWPFDPDKATGFGSSLIDLLVHNEIVQGRRVFMDFLQNPVAEAGMAEFDLNNLSEEARRYLERSGALQERPIDRLAHMNQPSIDLYAEKERDITREPLEVAVCNQHCNGGFKVNRWWETNVHRLFCIGEPSESCTATERIPRRSRRWAPPSATKSDNAWIGSSKPSPAASRLAGPSRRSRTKSADG